MAPPQDKTATTAERERLLALARRLEEGIEAIDADIVLRERNLAEIADDDANEPGARVKAGAAILSSQAKRADRLTSELSATRRALRSLPTEGDPETVRAMAERGEIPTVTDKDRLYGGTFVHRVGAARDLSYMEGQYWGDDPDEPWTTRKPEPR